MWSFQSRLGVITRTLGRAVPQLAHLLAVLAACMVLFGAALTLAAGTRAAEASTPGGGLYDTFLLLLGGGGVPLPRLLPPALAGEGPNGALAAQRLLGLAVFYGRQLLFVLVLMSFFLAVLGGVFEQAKARAAARGARSMPADVREALAPELAAWAAAAARRRRGDGDGNGSGGGCWPRRRLGAGAAVVPLAPGEEEAGVDVLAAPGAADVDADAAALADGAPLTSAALLARLRAAYPGLAPRRRAAPAGKVDAIRLELPGGSRLVNLGTLQRLLADLSAQGGAAALLAGLPAGAAHKAAAAGAPAGGGCAAAAAAAAPALAAGGDPRAVAAALALAEELVAQLGEPTGAAQLRNGALQLASTTIAAGDGGEVRRAAGARAARVVLRAPRSCHSPGCKKRPPPQPPAPSFPPHIQAPMSDLDNELLLHRQIHAALGHAAGAMGRWSAAVAKWQGHAARETNAWLEANAAALRAAGLDAGYAPVPVPREHTAVGADAGTELAAGGGEVEALGEGAGGDGGGGGGDVFVGVRVKSAAALHIAPSPPASRGLGAPSPRVGAGMRQPLGSAHARALEASPSGAPRSPGGVSIHGLRPNSGWEGARSGSGSGPAAEASPAATPMAGARASSARAGSGGLALFGGSGSGSGRVLGLDGPAAGADETARALWATLESPAASIAGRARASLSAGPAPGAGRGAPSSAGGGTRLGGSRAPGGGAERPAGAAALLPAADEAEAEGDSDDVLAPPGTVAE